MAIVGWEKKYSEIIKEFDYDKQQDYESAVLLNLILKNPVSLKKIKEIVSKKSVFVIGAGPSLSVSIKHLKKFPKIPKIVADSAAKPLLENNVKFDILVTDLDGDEKSLKKIGKSNSVFVTHAHGDNIAKLQIIENFKNCLGTTQTKPFGKIQNFGGFTDGDRGVFLADHFGAKNIILVGMDFGKIIGRYSKTKKSERKIKLKKLYRGKKLLEWFATKRKKGLYTTSKSIKGFKKICFKDLEILLDS
ncbi:MAG: 6-hydroxymethylpterin diphosphokinase MptE-like protein [Nitrosopumilaceae archaeon]